jgi:hypothetical protein
MSRPPQGGWHVLGLHRIASSPAPPTPHRQVTPPVAVPAIRRSGRPTGQLLRLGRRFKTAGKEERGSGVVFWGASSPLIMDSLLGPHPAACQPTQPRQKNQKHLSQHLRKTGARSKIATLERDRPGTDHRPQTPRLLRRVAANCNYKKQKTCNKKDPTIQT